MRKTGCGCLLLVLALTNLVFVVADIVYMIRGPSESAVEPSRLLLTVTMLIFVANTATCVMLWLQGLRRASFDRESAAQDADGSTVEASTFAGEEGTDEGED